MVAASGTATKRPTKPKRNPNASKRKDDPDRMQADVFTHQLGRQHVPLDELPE